MFMVMKKKELLNKYNKFEDPNYNPFKIKTSYNRATVFKTKGP